MGKAIAAILFFLAMLYVNIAGLIMCFQANVIIGVGALLVQGSGALEYLVWLFSGYDIAADLARALGLA